MVTTTLLNSLYDHVLPINKHGMIVTYFTSLTNSQTTMSVYDEWVTLSFGGVALGSVCAQPANKVWAQLISSLAKFCEPRKPGCVTFSAVE